MSLHCVASSSKHETGMRRPQQISQRVVNSSGNDVVVETRLWPRNASKPVFGLGPGFESCFSNCLASSPQVCNSLPPNLRLCGLSYDQFWRSVKTLSSDSDATAQCELFF